MSESNGYTFVLTGPSGSGKTTYSRMLVNRINTNCAHNITYTTRKPRKEESKTDYFKFVSMDEFNRLDNENYFFCTTYFCGNRYAYSTKDLITPLQNGYNLILDSIMPIKRLRELPGKVVVVYLTTLTNDELYSRITMRNPDIDKNELKLRAENFEEQKKIKELCDYIVYTDATRTKEEIFQEIIEIYKSEKPHI